MSEADQVLQDARDNLETARMGLENYRREDGRRRLGGIRNLVVFARSVTKVLQRLRSIDDSFDNWYAPYRREMSDDPLMSFFYELRNKVLKKGRLDTSVVTHVEKMNPSIIQSDFPPPPSAKRLILGDAQDGGSNYWLVEREDGTEKKFYIDPPTVDSSLEFPEPPEKHLGRNLEDKSIGKLAENYLHYLDEMVQEAERVFGS